MWSYSNFVEITKKYYKLDDLEQAKIIQLFQTFLANHNIGGSGFYVAEIENSRYIGFYKVNQNVPEEEPYFKVLASQFNGTGLALNRTHPVTYGIFAIRVGTVTNAIEYDNCSNYSEIVKALAKLGNYEDEYKVLKLIELLYDYILPKYRYDYYWIIESDGNFNEKFSSLKYKIKNFVNDTFKYYNKIIDLYTSKENNLLDKLKSTNSQSSSTTTAGNSITLENATPGTENESEYIFDETHTNSASKNTNDGTSENTSEATFEREVEPIIDQLNRIREKFDDIYTEWSNRFGEVLCGLDFD